MFLLVKCQFFHLLSTRASRIQFFQAEIQKEKMLRDLLFKQCNGKVDLCVVFV